MNDRRTRRLLTVACLLGLAALALMVWSVLVPTVLPVMVAMSIGQVVGTLSLAIYLVAVALDLRRARVLGRDDDGGPPGGGP